MMKTFKLHRILIVLLCLASTHACGEDRLNIQHIGEYAAVPWIAPGDSIVPGSREDRVKDLNLSVASVNLSDEMSDAFLARWALHARRGAAQGKVFLPRVYFWDGKDRFEGPLRDFEIYWQRMDTFLAAMPLTDFHGVILAEENVSGGGRAELLGRMYRRIKQKYDVAVYQWWSPGGSVPTWNIPSDGWVVDEYSLGGQDFRRLVQRYLVTGSELIIMPYAAWSSSEDPWPAVTHHILRDQLNVCREYNLPTAFFWVYNTGCNFGLGHDSFMDQVNAQILDWVQEVRRLPADFDGLPSADRSPGDALEIAPIGDRQLRYYDSFNTSQFIIDADIDGFRDLLWEQERSLAVRSWQGRKPKASLTYRFVGDFPADDIEASVDVNHLAPDARVTLSLSADSGLTWPLSTHTGGSGEAKLVISAASDDRFRDRRAFLVRISIAGGPTDGMLAARIDDIHITANLTVPDEPQIQLKADSDNPRKLHYADDFQTQKVRFSAAISDADKLEWERGSIFVRMQPEGAHPEIVWKVISPSAINNATVIVDGKANTRSLATDHYLDVSVDGRNWQHTVDTTDRPVNRSGWAVHGLQISTRGDPSFQGVSTFFVRLRMQAGSYKQVHPYRSGIITELRIEAATE